MPRSPATGGPSAIGFASLCSSCSPHSALGSIWTATTASCGVRPRQSRGSRLSPRSGGASTPSSLIPRLLAATTLVPPPPAALNRWNSRKEIFVRPQQMIWFFVSIAFSFIAWRMVTARYVWSEIRRRQRAEALRPLLTLHSFRFIGLAFLVPGVVSPDLPPAFAHAAAYGDIIAAILALLSLLSLSRGAGVVV